MHLHSHLVTQQGFSGGFSGKQSACNGSNPWVGKILWRRKWQLTPVFLPEEFQGQRSLAGYSPRGRTVIYDLATKQQTRPFWDRPPCLPSARLLFAE